MAGTRGKRKQVAEMNVVPYIDVMLVLLVIFMITAPLLQTGVEIDLPNADAKPIESSPEQTEPLILSMNDRGDWFLNVGEDPESPLDEQSIKRLSAAVLRLDPQRRVLVKADAAVDYGTVVRGMAALQQAGAKSIGLMAEPLSK